MKTTINLSLDLAEVNAIVKALSEGPFKEVYELIGKVHAQSSAQLSSAERSGREKQNPVAP